MFLQKRSEIVATYALCGFSNPGSIGTQVAALATMAPERKSDLAQVAFRAFVAGSIACFMTACIAGTVYKIASFIAYLCNCFLYFRHFDIVYWLNASDNCCTDVNIVIHTKHYTSIFPVGDSHRKSLYREFHVQNLTQGNIRRLSVKRKMWSNWLLCMPFPSFACIIYKSITPKIVLNTFSSFDIPTSIICASLTNSV